ncbi:MAG: hypothetical protein RBR47_06445 [Bacteroidales bacterium]|jgi:hypothetical protein|nr:hypothetical protein [Bacteroidales bacterium]NCU35501.1 hypothetical protein [Candidatus Falkowbacteria bacterium]MDD2632883.1 hypothetical protein [Bacteroidales bacterium]MDD3130646.1 hypothetical protein [Bacteroidales bacterium]MDD3525806.1 hypothetical protein [Bacteroidales bacterium]
MEQPISLEYTDQKIVISLERSAFEKDVVFEILNRIRTEYLVKKADIGEEIESLGEELKSDWWEKNKKKFIG